MKFKRASIGLTELPLTAPVFASSLARRDTRRISNEIEVDDDSGVMAGGVRAAMVMPPVKKNRPTFFGAYRLDNRRIFPIRVGLVKDQRVAVGIVDVINHGPMWLRQIDVRSEWFWAAGRLR